MKYLGIWDFIWVPIYLFLVHYWANRKVRRNADEHPEYKYYRPGLLFKVYSGLAFALIYAFYYGGGDTMVYWADAKTLNTLILSEPLCYLRILSGDTDPVWYFCFDLREHIPFHYLRDPQSYNTSRYASPMALLSVDSLLGCTILVAWVSFVGVWRLYRVFCEEYPGLHRELAIAFLFIPSVAFWGSGVMKDTFTLTAACWMTSSVYGLVLRRRQIVWNTFYMLISSYVMITLKPYVFVALLPGIMLWIVFNRIQTIQNQIVRLMAAPIIIMIGFVAAAAVFSQASGTLGDYGSVNSLVDRAVATQEDLKRDAYAGNSFDIGTIDPTIGGMLSKAPVAIFAGLFRPTLLDVKNPLMLVSAIENTVIMVFLLYMILRIGPLAFTKYTLGKPMILFSFVFAVFFSFAVGLTTSNFGSLVRYKIPALPFFLASLYMMRYNQRKDQMRLMGVELDSDTKELSEEDFIDSNNNRNRPPFLPKPYG